MDCRHWGYEAYGGLDVLVNNAGIATMQLQLKKHPMNNGAR